MACHNPRTRLPSPSSVMLLRRRFHDPIDRRFGGDIFTPVDERWHDLARRLARKLGTVDQGQDMRTLLVAQLVGRRYAARILAPILNAGTTFLRPALVGAQADLQHFTGPCAPAATTNSV